jgi:hypothetical protein
MVERRLGKHPSVPLNPDVANTVFRAGQIEWWGHELERMVQVRRHEEPGRWVGSSWVAFTFSTLSELEAS